MNTTGVTNQHPHWSGCMRSNALANLNDGASIKGAVLALNHTEGVIAAQFLSSEIERMAPCWTAPRS